MILSSGKVQDYKKEDVSGDSAYSDAGTEDDDIDVDGDADVDIVAVDSAEEIVKTESRPRGGYGKRGNSRVAFSVKFASGSDCHAAEKLNCVLLAPTPCPVNAAPNETCEVREARGTLGKSSVQETEHRRCLDRFSGRGFVVYEVRCSFGDFSEGRVLCSSCSL